MPFYLVTHTSLIEAENEVHAAEKAVADLRTGQAATVAVKSDETTVRHVRVAPASVITPSHPRLKTAENESEACDMSEAVKIVDTAGPNRWTGSHALLCSVSLGAIALFILALAMC